MMSSHPLRLYLRHHLLSTILHHFLSSISWELNAIVREQKFSGDRPAPTDINAIVRSWENMTFKDCDWYPYLDCFKDHIAKTGRWKDNWYMEYDDDTKSWIGYNTFKACVDNYTPKAYQPLEENRVSSDSLDDGAAVVEQDGWQDSNAEPIEEAELPAFLTRTLIFPSWAQQGSNNIVIDNDSDGTDFYGQDATPSSARTRTKVGLGNVGANDWDRICKYSDCCERDLGVV
jgi:hypothetical protein